MKSKVVLLALAGLFSFQSFADVLPDKNETEARHFISITKVQNRYQFRLCLLQEKKNCTQLGNQVEYTLQELKAKEQELKERGHLYAFGGLLTGGLSLLGTARLYLIRKTISIKNLERTVQLEYKVDERGTATGSIYDYVEKLEKALNVKPSVSAPATTTTK